VQRSFGGNICVYYTTLFSIAQIFAAEDDLEHPMPAQNNTKHPIGSLVLLFLGDFRN
jgi:hypothetical protein